jgi:hypothetical protein
MKRPNLSRNTYLVLLITTISLIASGTWAWNRYGPSQHVAYEMEAQRFSPILNPGQSTSACDLKINRYKQIGNEVQFELYASAAGLAPYSIEINQGSKNFQFESIAHRAGTWLTLPNLELSNGKAKIIIKSKNDAECQASGEFLFDGNKSNEILASNQWIRQGSKDTHLDIRVISQNQKLYLKDFADYTDGRTKVYLIDNVMVSGLEEGIEVQPGYLYSVVACWIDAPYSEWWNHLRNRTIRQQNIWIKPKKKNPVRSGSTLQIISIPDWFALSDHFTVLFDKTLPAFEPIQNKLVMQYRLNEGVSPESYLTRGITHLPKWESTLPPKKMHWTESPGFFGDREQDWFSSLTKAEVESFADQVYPSNVYSYDFEFWNRNYIPEVRQRLIWFSQRIKRNNPNGYLFDYWGGGAYHNPNFTHDNSLDPAHFSSDYSSPKATHSNFEPDANGVSMASFFSITPVDVYPKRFFGDDSDGVTPTNYLLLSAVHTARINRLFPYQKNNKTIWFAWNRYMPLYKDPVIPWHIQTTAPKGELVFDELVTMPASQALGMSLFSLIESDGYYLWHDNQAQGDGVNNYTLDPSEPAGFQWYPADGVSSVTGLKKDKNKPDSPRYWDYPTEYFALGNWMAKQVEDILSGGRKVDLDYQMNGKWIEATVDQAVQSAERKEPFVLSVVNDNKVAILAIDSFQKPTSLRRLTIRLPNGKVEQIELYGNWPSLYRGIF